MAELENDSLSRREFLQTTGAVAAASMIGTRAFAGADKPKDTKIAYAKIHPGIGVARIGNSEAAGEAGYFIGPEIIEPPLTPEGFSRDELGALKRQAARFRIYAYNAAHEVISELTSSESVKIEWTVELANKKAQWFRFSQALDIKQSKGMTVPRRNPLKMGSERDQLAITPKPQTVEGKNHTGEQAQFNGFFMKDTPVNLGELRTDEKGRLLVLGGKGKAASPTGKQIYNPKDEGSFNNADEWYDDTADGPVDAKVTINGEAVKIEASSWVFVAPPNYAPDIIGWRTLYDLLLEKYYDAKMLTRPTHCSFTADIYPILRRLTNLQWVNKGFADTYGTGCEMDFSNPVKIAKLADKTHSNDKTDIYSKFRIPGTHEIDKEAWPMIYGDAFGSVLDDGNEHFEVPDLLQRNLKRWVAGDYTNDWNAMKEIPKKLSDIPLKDRPGMVDRAALHFCIADAFHPGCEVTWPMRQASMYNAPFRIKRVEGAYKDTYKDKLEADSVLNTDGPCNAQTAGDLTKWMAIPWHGDTAFCRSGYDPKFNPYLPTFWPARVPNQVLSEDTYLFVTRKLEPEEEKDEDKKAQAIKDKIAAFKKRENWVRLLTKGPVDQMEQMVAHFSEMGVVEARPGVTGIEGLPTTMFVESLVKPKPGNETRGLSPRPKVFAAGLETPGGKPDPVLEAGWENPEQLEEFKNILFRPHR